MIVGHNLFAVAVLNAVKLETGFAEQFAAEGNGFVDRREFEKVVLTLAGPGKQQQYKPNRLHR